MGSGHDGVAQELRRRFEAVGYHVEVKDLLAVLPGPLGWCLKAFYAAMLRFAPWLYEGIYRVWFQPKRGGGGPVSPVTALAQRRLGRWVVAHRPVLAVSTFHLCSTVLAGLRRQGTLSAPTASTVVDFAVHRLWVDPDIDLHLCLHPEAATEAERRGAPRASAPGPVVRPCFTDPVWDRSSARRSLDLGEDHRVVLVVAGSWGTGELEATLRLVSPASDLTPIVVCGSDGRLRRRLSSLTGTLGPGGQEPKVLGWVRDMDRLMAAADVVLENAGGLTCMEALASGVPVVSFAPIPGHGRANVAAMAECGLVAWVRGPEDLVPTLRLAATATPLRSRLLRAGRALFTGDAATEALSLIEASPLPSGAGPGPSERALRDAAQTVGRTGARTRPLRPTGTRTSRSLPRARRRPAVVSSAGRGRPRDRRRRRRLLRRVPMWAPVRRTVAAPRRRAATSLLIRVPTWRRPAVGALRPSRRGSRRGRMVRRRR